MANSIITFAFILCAIKGFVHFIAGIINFTEYDNPGNATLNWAYLALHIIIVFLFATYIRFNGV